MPVALWCWKDKHISSLPSPSSPRWWHKLQLCSLGSWGPCFGLAHDAWNTGKGLEGRMSFPRHSPHRAGFLRATISPTNVAGLSPPEWCHCSCFQSKATQEGPPPKENQFPLVTSPPLAQESSLPPFQGPRSFPLCLF